VFCPPLLDFDLLRILSFILVSVRFFPLAISSTFHRAKRSRTLSITLDLLYVLLLIVFFLLLLLLLLFTSALPVSS